MFLCFFNFIHDTKSQIKKKDNNNFGLFQIILNFSVKLNYLK